MTTTTPARRRSAGRLAAGAVPLILLLGFVFLCVAAPSIWGDRAAANNIAQAGQGMSAAHWAGTDDLGRDIFARTLVATRNSLVLAVLATLVGGAVGVALGLVSGSSRRLGRFVGAVISVLLAFPAMLLSIFFAVLFGIGSVGSVLAVGAAFIPGFARITQTLTASVVGREYVDAARVLGKRPASIALRHILPNIAEPILLYATIHIGTAILSLAGLSFLGLGLQPPSFDWGRLLSDGLTRVYISPGAALAPAVAIVLAGLTFNMFGEWLSDLVAGRAGAARRVVPAPVPAADGAAPAPARGGHLLDVRHLRVTYAGHRGAVSTPVRDVSFTLAPGETMGIVGESGSGKSMTTSAIAQLVDGTGVVDAQTLRFLDVDLLAPDRHSDKVLGRSMSMVFQDPGEALNPAVKIGTHLLEPAVIHLGDPKRVARGKALEALRAVAIDDPARRYRQHQHELSGGMKQRVCIAIGLMGEPKLLIADEPTTALDVTVQRQILRLISRVGRETGAAMLFISHDVAVVAEVCDRVLVMYAGFVVEDAPTAALLAGPAHPYTALLVAASPTMTIDTTAPLPTLDGRMPPADVELPGCYFADRCPRADATCTARRPPLLDIGAPGDGHRAACWHPLVGADRAADANPVHEEVAP
ncbi:dipeptide/oligopeptide/nickel ABC transporter permease/ATP-binding protein [Dactylosporangium sp. CA-092794]|uniref:dipeptide/oligopeptide/nickel ABC transporter permease/ATP-binding protein n=1 Tax=Dactylosporangium sp. CA-092794 TaxID=3239929 RepID=UPI003D8F9AF5